MWNKVKKNIPASIAILGSQVSVIFIQENAAFNQVLTYQDWRNQLLNTIDFILLPNFKESFFNYLKLGQKVADFSERSSRRFSLAVGTYWKHCIYVNTCLEIKIFLLFCKL